MDIFNQILNVVNNTVIIIFCLSFSVQILYIVFFFIPARKFKPAKRNNRIAIIVPARNEEDVIGETVKNLRSQNYPKEFFDIIIFAHNCTDGTAEAARREGAIAIEINDDNPDHKRVSYALKYGLAAILKYYDNYDFFVRFDADNFAHPDYLMKMNDAYDAGVHIAKGYNNAKNISQNVISSISGLWYVRDSRFSCNARSAFHFNQILSGAGMMFSAQVARKNGGWKEMGYCEDADFSLGEFNEGIRSEYVKGAIVYEDQPASLKETFKRNMRMGRGLKKTFGVHGIKALGKFFTTFKVGYVDMFLTELFIPLAFVAVVWFPFFYIFDVCYKFGVGNTLDAMAVLDTLWKILVFAFAIPFIAQALLAYVLERKRIKGSFIRLLPGMILFPLFMVFYAMGIAFGVIFRPKWKPIKRNVVSAAEFARDPTQHTQRVYKSTNAEAAAAKDSE